jgi:lipopolysaccharide/colanic/teichoic acid biosynthesis glycosyltransferase
MLKRGFDIVASGVALVVLLPLMLVLAILVRLDSPGPSLFIQARVGKSFRQFQLLKFRSMTHGKSGAAITSGKDARITRLGAFLRGSKLDELPQLWNVLCGDMSLVGPRPLLMDYLPRYSPEQARRHEVMPGITGWSQINGRNALTWEEKFALDGWYVDNWSLGLDARILLATFLRVVGRDGISKVGHATMPEFYGKTPAVEVKTCDR